MIIIQFSIHMKKINYIFFYQNTQMNLIQQIKKITPEFLYKFLRYIYMFILYDIKYILVGFKLSFQKHIKMYEMIFIFPKMSYKRLGNYFFNYEKYEIYLISKYINKNATILELGGCIGVVSNKINSLIINKKNHIVLEPNIHICNFLLQNKKLNNSFFEVENTIISKNESVDFFVYEDVLWSSVYVRDNILNKKISIKTTSVENLKNKYKLIFDTLVMDIEGGELDLLTDNSFINNFKSMFIEFHPDIYGNVGQEK
jgi:FkbM family methyltransferase